MRIAVGCDHRGLEFKEAVMRLLAEAGHEVEDSGCYSTDSVDYPDIALKVAESVTAGKCKRGILICDTGIGMSIAANKVRGIRAALCCDSFSTRRARQHNNANILCLGVRNGQKQLAEILDAFVNTVFEAGRHERRLEKIKDMENR